MVLAAMRWGPSAARKATTATTLLLLGVLPACSCRHLLNGFFCVPLFNVSQFY